MLQYHRLVQTFFYILAYIIMYRLHLCLKNGISVCLRRRTSLVETTGDQVSAVFVQQKSDISVISSRAHGDRTVRLKQ